MLPSAGAVLGKLQLVRSRPLVLVRVVVALAAHRALERHQSPVSTCHDPDLFTSNLPKNQLLDDLRDDAGADGAAAFADGEAQAFLGGDGRDELDVDVDVVA